MVDESPKTPNDQGHGDREAPQPETAQPEQPVAEDSTETTTPEPAAAEGEPAQPAQGEGPAEVAAEVAPEDPAPASPAEKLPYVYSREEVIGLNPIRAQQGLPPLDMPEEAQALVTLSITSGLTLLLNGVRIMGTQHEQPVVVEAPGWDIIEQMGQLLALTGVGEAFNLSVPPGVRLIVNERERIGSKKSTAVVLTVPEVFPGLRINGVQ